MDAPIAIVMAAGKGTRMKSDLPKVLCQANGRPLVSYVLDALSGGGRCLDGGCGGLQSGFGRSRIGG